MDIIKIIITIIIKIIITIIMIIIITIINIITKIIITTIIIIIKIMVGEIITKGVIMTMIIMIMGKETIKKRIIIKADINKIRKRQILYGYKCNNFRIM